MNTTNDGRLKAAAQEGDVNLLYKQIEEDPYILEHIDSIPFVETPLHIAASFGQLQFAAEVMRLKPSFVEKLNPQGFSPIHLAMQKGQKRMVLRFVDINKDLVRVKGREGLTPLHFASQTGDVELLASFLFAWPESIKDVTVRGETALHIAVKSKQYEALQVLVGWLKKKSQKDAMNLEQAILNAKDEAGNTILHISALNNDSQSLRLLVKTWVDLNAMNLENSTALDIAPNEEIKSILRRAGAKQGSPVIDAPTRVEKLASDIRVIIDPTTFLKFRIFSEMSQEQRNVYLVVLTLVVSAAFQIAVSPPGGVYQANAGDNSTATATQSNNAGTSVLSHRGFSLLSVFNTISLLLSTGIVIALTPVGKMGALLVTPIYWLLCTYLYSMKVISPPSSAISRFHYILFYIYLSGLISCILYVWMTIIIPEGKTLFGKVRKLYNILRA